MGNLCNSTKNETKSDVLNKNLNYETTHNISNTDNIKDKIQIHKENCNNQKNINKEDYIKSKIKLLELDKLHDEAYIMKSNKQINEYLNLIKDIKFLQENLKFYRQNNKELFENNHDLEIEYKNINNKIMLLTI